MNPLSLWSYCHFIYLHLIKYLLLIICTGIQLNNYQRWPKWNNIQSFLFGFLRIRNINDIHCDATKSVKGGNHLNNRTVISDVKGQRQFMRGFTIIKWLAAHESWSGHDVARRHKKVENHCSRLSSITAFMTAPITPVHSLSRHVLPNQHNSCACTISTHDTFLCLSLCISLPMPSLSTLYLSPPRSPSLSLSLPPLFLSGGEPCRRNSIEALLLSGS